MRSGGGGHKGFHDCGVSLRSSAPSRKSAAMASSAAGMAPARITELLTMATPRKMKTPRPPAPMAAAMVATPMQTARWPRARRRGSRPSRAATRPAKASGAASCPWRARLRVRRGPRRRCRCRCCAKWAAARRSIKRDDGGAGANAAQKRHGNQEAKQREAGNGLNDVGRAQNPAAQRAAAVPGRRRGEGR